MDTGSAARTPGFRREGPTGPLRTTTHHWSRQPCPAGVKFYRWGGDGGHSGPAAVSHDRRRDSLGQCNCPRERNLVNVGGVPVTSALLAGPGDPQVLWDE